MNKVIYFPTGLEPGMNKGFPCIFYVIKIIKSLKKSYYKGSRNIEEARSGRGSWILVNKCLDYSDEAWELCVDYIKRKAAIENEWTKLRMNIKRSVKDGNTKR